MASTSPAHVTLHVPGQHPFYGGLLDTSGGGAAVLVENRAVEDLDVGAPVELEFIVPGLTHNLPVPSKLRHRVEIDDLVRCLFEYDSPNVLEHEIPYSLRKAFDRRSEPRVDVSAHDCQVMLRDSSGADLESKLVDVSPRGLAVSVPAEKQPFLGGDDELLSFFSLPNCATPFHLSVTVRRLQSQGSEARAGLRFENVYDSENKEQREALLDFVAEFVQWSALDAAS